MLQTALKLDHPRPGGSEQASDSSDVAPFHAKFAQSVRWRRERNRAAYVASTSIHSVRVDTMAKQSRPQKKTVGRVMHEYKHGELKSGGRRKVKNPKQAVAIALSEAGASKYQSQAEKRRSLQRTKRREARGETAQAEREGTGRGRTARRTKTRAASSRATARRGAPRKAPTRRAASRAAATRGGAARRTSGGRAPGKTKAQLYREAKRRNIPGRSKMSKGQLQRAVGAG